jgi:hypothetical protein
MGKWDSILEKIIAYSEESKKTLGEETARYQQVLDAANSFASGHSKAATKVARLALAVRDATESCASVVAELAVHEEEYERAKKAKNKERMKELEAKMKALEKTFENRKGAVYTAVDDSNRALEEIEKLATPLKAALG